MRGCLPDGGDSGAPVGLDRNGQVGGLDPSDTVAAYTDYRGKRRLSVSNRVCICVPRFVIIRGETILNGYETRVGLVGARKIVVREQMEGRLPLQEREKYEELVGQKFDV